MQLHLGTADRHRLRALDLRDCTRAVQLNQKQTEELQGLHVVRAPRGFSRHPDGLDGCQLRWYTGTWTADSATPWNKMASLGVLEISEVGGHSH